MKEFCFKTSRGPLVCNEKNIIKVTSISNYSKIFFDDSSTLVVAKVLKWFETVVTPGQFIRINQSVLLNIDHVKSIDLKNKLVVSDYKDEIFRISKNRMLEMKENPPILIAGHRYNKTVA